MGRSIILHVFVIEFRQLPGRIPGLAPRHSLGCELAGRPAGRGAYKLCLPADKISTRATRTRA